jgi:hypothetical protein
MSKIYDNLKKVHAAVALDNAKPGGGKLGEDIGKLAVAAITGGIKSPAWSAYMSLFADNAEQLERLVSDPPPPDESYLPQLRAYIVSNAVCAADTGTFVADRVDERVNGDATSDAVDAQFIADNRPLDIPELPNG